MSWEIEGESRAGTRAPASLTTVDGDYGRATSMAYRATAAVGEGVLAIRGKAFARRTTWHQSTKRAVRQ